MKLVCSLVAAMSLSMVACGDDPKGFVEEPMEFSNGDGGEIRIENLIFPDGVSRTLLTAHFFDEQTGQMTFPNFGAGDNGELNCNWVGGSGGEGSTLNPNPDHIFPFGDDSDDIGSTATFAPGGRHYLDVGETVTLQPLTGDRDEIVLTKYLDHVTPFTGGSFHPIVYDPAPSDDPTLAIPADLMGGTGPNVDGDELSVTLAGGPDAPATTFTFETVGENTFAGIKIPPRPVIEGFSELGVPSASEFVRDQSYTFEYDVPASADPDLLGFVGIFQTSPTFEVTHICLHGHPGKVTITPELMEQMAPTGILFVAHLYHRLRTLDNNRRVDMVGTACTSTGYTLVDPA